MANYPQKKKPKQEEMGSADDGAAYVKEKGRAERDWAEDAANKTEERGARALEERLKEVKYYKKGGLVRGCGLAIKGKKFQGVL